MREFKVVSPFEPGGDQGQAIDKLSQGFLRGDKFQTLKGVTGSGKTFTMAKIIEKVQKPTLIISHNKTLSAQLYREFKSFFPNNAVEYFVSYYDYYQPEAYVAARDLYIEKDSSINDEIDELRHAATAAIIDRRDTIIVSSVSCIYSIGEKEEYIKKMLNLYVGQTIERDRILEKLVSMQYERNELDLKRGTFRAKGDTIELIPIGEKKDGIRIEMFDDEIEKLSHFDPLTGRTTSNVKTINVFPASLFVTSDEKMIEATKRIEEELKGRLVELKNDGKLLEEQLLRDKINSFILLDNSFAY